MTVLMAQFHLRNLYDSLCHHMWYRFNYSCSHTWFALSSIPWFRNYKDVGKYWSPIFFFIKEKTLFGCAVFQRWGPCLLMRSVYSLQIPSWSTKCPWKGHIPEMPRYSLCVGTRASQHFKLCDIHHGATNNVFGVLDEAKNFEHQFNNGRKNLNPFLTFILKLVPMQYGTKCNLSVNCMMKFDTWNMLRHLLE
jgi:hypothetical protein